MKNETELLKRKTRQALALGLITQQDAAKIALLLRQMAKLRRDFDRCSKANDILVVSLEQIVKIDETEAYDAQARAYMGNWARGALKDSRKLLRQPRRKQPLKQAA